MNEHEIDLLEETRQAMRAGEVRLTITPTFTHGDAVRIEVKTGTRFKKVGPLIFPPADGSLADVLSMLAEMRTGVSA